MTKKNVPEGKTESATPKPKNCLEENTEEICYNCSLLDHENVSHPGGESTKTVKKYSCGLGYWMDDF